MGEPVVAFLLLGVIVGGFAGLLGIGGAVVLVPALVLVFGFTQARAQGTSVGALLPPVAILAAIQYYRAGQIDVRVAMLVGIGFVFGAFGGAALVPHIPQTWLKRLFASLLVYMAVQLAFADAKTKGAMVVPGLIAAAGLWVVWAIRAGARRLKTRVEGGGGGAAG